MLAVGPIPRDAKAESARVGRINIADQIQKKSDLTHYFWFFVKSAAVAFGSGERTQRCYRSPFKTPDRISERPRRGGLSVLCF